MARLYRSTIARFVVFIFALQLAATAGILFYVHQASANAFEKEQQALVVELRDDLVAGYHEGGQDNLAKLINARLDAIRSELPVILLVAAKGEVVAGNLSAWPTTIPYQTSWRTLNLYRMAGNRPEHIGLMTTALPDGAHLLTGHVIDGDVRLTQINEQAMTAAFLIAVPLALAIALLLGRMINVRARRIAMTAAAVGHGDLSHRVELDGSGDAFDALGRGVNTMLDRIETLVSELRIVTDGLAHDLRSPITRLKSTLERAIIETDDPAALTALEKVSVESETLLAMLTTALQISRAEAGIGRDRFVKTDVRDMLLDLVEIYGPLAEDQGMLLTANAPLGSILPLHRELVSQALGNLIENAIKYATGGRKIALDAAPTSDGMLLSVADDGVGIPESRRIEARRKFGRLDPARNISGSGLGLSLVDAVTRLHGGDMQLEENAPGLRVSMKLSS